MITDTQKKILAELTNPAVLLAGRHADMTFEQALAYFEQRGLRYELEERAAILEYDGGLHRDRAERQAVREMFERS